MQDLHSPNRSLPLTLVSKTRIKSAFGANTLQVVHKKKDSRNFRYYMRVSIRYFPSLVYERIKGRDVIVFDSCIFICLCKQMKGLCSSTKECIPRYIQLEIANLDSNHFFLNSVITFKSFSPFTDICIAMTLQIPLFIHNFLVEFTLL